MTKSARDILVTLLALSEAYAGATTAELEKINEQDCDTGVTSLDGGKNFLVSVSEGKFKVFYADVQPEDADACEAYAIQRTRDRVIIGHMIRDFSKDRTYLIVNDLNTPALDIGDACPKHATLRLLLWNKYHDHAEIHTDANGKQTVVFINASK